MKHFNMSEFACPCCGENETDILFVLGLDRAREAACTPFVINSGYRCEEHNRHVGGSETSSHLRGEACDIDAKTAHQKFLILRALFELGFTRIGVGEDFIHVDVDTEKPDRLVWTY